ncbi:pinin [Bicyclus anynana]|uniref:Pinin n=1 Tax=Bicyclus anynana TaxID=110368 RepID=A0A6J1NCF3_BICAN|nr:pinin [Bicyclus anynana]
MGTEVALSFSSLRAQLESEKSSLFKIDENIKKIVQTSGRFTDRFNASTDYTRGGSRVGGRNSYPDAGHNYRNDEQPKRKHETKTVFSRLSGRAHDSDGEDEGVPKRARVPSAVCRELPSRASVLRAQGDDEQARTRNRRIFGSLLGTLQKFKQEEIVLQTKEDKKAQVERKIEEQARQEKERELKERKTLFAEREHKKATIKALEAKMARLQEFERWEAAHGCLGNFILCKAKPSVYWLPKKMSEKAQEKLDESKKYHEKYLSRKRQELQEELRRIEQKCLRPRGFAAKENAQDAFHEGGGAGAAAADDERTSKRDKFAMDVDEKEREDSDGEERPEGVEAIKEEKESDQSKMDTSVEQNVSMETDDVKNEQVHTNDTGDTRDTAATESSDTRDSVAEPSAAQDIAATEPSVASTQDTEDDTKET